MGIMGGLQTKNFSTCSLSAMHHRLQQVYKNEDDNKCFTNKDENKVGKYKIEVKAELVMEFFRTIRNRKG